MGTDTGAKMTSEQTEEQRTEQHRERVRQAIERYMAKQKQGTKKRQRGYGRRSGGGR